MKASMNALPVEVTPMSHTLNLPENDRHNKVADTWTWEMEEQHAPINLGWIDG